GVSRTMRLGLRGALSERLSLPLHRAGSNFANDRHRRLLVAAFCRGQPQLRDRAMDMSWILIAVLTFLLALVVLSYIVEALRSAPKRPETLVWAPRVPIEYVDLGGMRVRRIRTGVGPNLVLLHTLRTQLDIRSSRSASRSMPLTIPGTAGRTF